MKRLFVPALCLLLLTPVGSSAADAKPSPTKPLVEVDLHTLTFNRALPFDRDFVITGKAGKSKAIMLAIDTDPPNRYDTYLAKPDDKERSFAIPVDALKSGRSFSFHFTYTPKTDADLASLNATLRKELAAVQLAGSPINAATAGPVAARLKLGVPAAAVIARAWLRIQAIDTALCGGSPCPLAVTGYLLDRDNLSPLIPQVAAVLGALNAAIPGASISDQKRLVELRRGLGSQNALLAMIHGLSPGDAPPVAGKMFEDIAREAPDVARLSAFGTNYGNLAAGLGIVAQSLPAGPLKAALLAAQTRAGNAQAAVANVVANASLYNTDLSTLLALVPPVSPVDRTVTANTMVDRRVTGELGLLWAPALEAGSPYGGLSYALARTNENLPMKLLAPWKWCRFWEHVPRRLALSLGVSLAKLGNESETRQDLVGDNSALTGLTFRVNRSSRLGLGLLHLLKTRKTPLRDETQWSTAWYFSFSIEGDPTKEASSLAGWISVAAGALTKAVK